MACAACGSVAVRSCDRIRSHQVGHHLAAAERSAGDENRETQEPLGSFPFWLTEWEIGAIIIT